MSGVTALRVESAALFNHESPRLLFEGWISFQPGKDGK